MNKSTFTWLMSQSDQIPNDTTLDINYKVLDAAMTNYINELYNIQCCRNLLAVSNCLNFLCSM